MSRIKNTRRIILSGVINRVLNLIFPFVNRTVIIWLLGAEFTGLSGLFTSILQVLSLTEFGFHMTVSYSLYKPLAEKNIEEINKIMSMLRKVYFLVGSTIIAMGLIIMPFIKFLIKGDYPDSINIYILFLLYLINSGISYFLFAYKGVLINADQRQDLTTRINTAVCVFVNIMQYVVLLIFRNFYLYVLMTIIGSIVSNLLINRAANKRYPYLKTLPGKIEIPSEMKKQISGLMINSLSNVSRNSLDNLVISSTLGLVVVTKYGNYFTIYSAVFGLINIISNSMGASVGNSIVLKSKHDNFENLLDFSLLYSWIAGWCAATMACLYQPFMQLWVGEELMLPTKDMLLFVLYFYLINMNHMRNEYILGNAIWWRLKGAYLAEAIGNLVLNIVLGKLWGITGIIIATNITIFFCNYLMCNSVLFKTYFKGESIKVFYKQQFYYLAVAIAVTGVAHLFCSRFESIIIRALICIFVSNCLFAVLFYPCSRWKSSIDLVKKIISVH